ncbi:rCG23912, isoform CRA_b [Rattus norvegicus]|uniref:RCG23912, isoform CRA_b n=1 Tax=Rattus norvegicus TaxID=10116 RepID=A6JWC4_RAT|nr:rCG23912, isoform CRA_b [Rattus norvegicus]
MQSSPIETLFPGLLRLGVTYFYWQFQIINYVCRTQKTYSFNEDNKALSRGTQLCHDCEFIVCSSLILILTGHDPHHGVHQKDSICQLMQQDSVSSTKRMLKPGPDIYAQRY